jgi:hypothetical protein
VKAEQLMLGTACKESKCGLWLVQLGGGPALGLFQMEPGMTGHDDIWANYLAFQPDLTLRVKLLMILSETPRAEEMVGNLYYACAMARIKYVRDFFEIPADLAGQAAYWKRVYNTRIGKGTIEEYIAAWHEFVPPSLSQELWPQAVA